MDKLLSILGASLGSIAAGYIAQVVLTRRGRADRERLLAASRYMKLAAFFVIQPVAIAVTFWKMAFMAGQVVLFPFLGLFSVFVSGGTAIVAIKLLDLPPLRAASVFVTGMFTNVLTFGGLIGYVFFGESGYGLAQLFTTFISASYYLVGFPVSNNIAHSDGKLLRVDFRVMARHPLVFVPIAAMILGAVLNVTGVPRPGFIEHAVGAIVPTVAVLLGLSIGLSLRFSKLRENRREVAVVMLIKFVLLPAVMIPIGVALGLPGVGDGTPFKMLVVLSVMPVAFNALVPPAIFGFDLDLANSAWIVTTGCLVVIVPLLYVLLL